MCHEHIIVGNNDKNHEGSENTSPHGELKWGMSDNMAPGESSNHTMVGLWGVRVFVSRYLSLESGFALSFEQSTQIASLRKEILWA